MMGCRLLILLYEIHSCSNVSPTASIPARLLIRLRPRDKIFRFFRFCRFWMLNIDHYEFLVMFSGVLFDQSLLEDLVTKKKPKLSAPTL